MNNKLLSYSKLLVLLQIVTVIAFSSLCAAENQSAEKDDKLITKKDICFSSSDTLEIISFYSKMDSLINSNDTTEIIGCVNFPLNVDGDEIDQMRFITEYYSSIVQYLVKSHINKDELESLERIEEFVKKEDASGCYQYFISNSFSELEFSVDIYLEKINDNIKVISLSIIG